MEKEPFFICMIQSIIGIIDLKIKNIFFCEFNQWYGFLRIDMLFIVYTANIFTLTEWNQNKIFYIVTCLTLNYIDTSLIIYYKKM